MPTNIFKRPFYFQRFWSGRIMLFGFKAFAVELDFRRNWIADMANPHSN